jgi:multidrug efflux system membrane fusion protein
MKKSYIIAAAILILASLWIGSGFLGDQTHEQAATETPETVADQPSELMKVRVINSVAQNYKKNIRLNGRSQPSKNITLSAEAEGQIIEILADEGETVIQGTEIIKIDVREREERVREAAELVKQRQIEYNAAQKLIKQGYSSDVRLAQTRSALESARASLTRAELALQKTVITAPFDGVLGERHVDIGDFVSIGTALSNMVDLNPLEVTIFVNEKDVVQIQEGDAASVRFSNGAIIDGVITFIAPAADEQSRTFKVDVELPNDDNNLRAGLTAEVTIETIDKLAHKISPAILTLNDAGDVGVKTVTNDNIVQFTPITIIADEPTHMWVSGLPDQVKIITVGQDFVLDGQKVDPRVAE